MSEFDGLVAIVTGGASGIGAATVRTLLERGARVAALDLNPDGAPEGSLGIGCDVTDREGVQRAVQEVVDAFGGIDVVVNNAGIGAAGDVSGNDDDEWLRVLDVNVVSIARVTAAALPHLRRSAHAAVVNTASVVAVVGLPNRALYGATKGAVHALTLGMAADHIRDGIRVNAVAPGTADTPWVGRLLAASDDPDQAAVALRARQPMGRLVTADEVAHAIAYLASPRSASTTGTLLTVDGGLTGVRV
jgi:NAD(P)-dependent dehydrogenase (short-subunit alcohol dehydrogenase family)